ncbi:MAG: terminase family protein [Eubacteriales bacterium]|nr:terminase family protein [Eubacteriales bacterium]
MRLSEKQKEYWNEGYHRWNIKYGATRSGKTYLDYFLIPKRIRERAGQEGRIVLLGNTRGTLRRNVLDPMTELFGEEMVGPMNSEGMVRMFGETVYCLGAGSPRAADRLRGASIKYCYGDEVVSWDEEVFGMVKSRLDKPYSCFDGTCNPKDPEHWLCKFLNSGADIFAQQYALDDNPFLDERVREALKREHRGVFYERYILGKWVTAEGLVFPEFAREPERWLVQPEAGERFEKIVIGVDFGGFGSRTAMTAAGFRNRYREIWALDEMLLPAKESLDAQDISEAFVEFYRRVAAEYGKVDQVFGDSASPTIQRGAGQRRTVHRSAGAAYLL